MKIFLRILLFYFILLGFMYAGDLDDGISNYTDDSISADDQVFKKEVNMAYIKTLANAKKFQKDSAKKHKKQKVEKTFDEKGIGKDNKGNMYISRKSSIRPGDTIVNNPEGGKDMEGNMIIDPDVKIPIGARVINAPKFKRNQKGD